MKVQKYLPIIIIAGMLLAACAPGQSQGPAVTPTGAAPTPIAETSQPPQAAQAAVQWLADRLGITADEITLRSVELVEFPNACLGLPEIGEMCAEVITGGFRLELEAGGMIYDIHTDMDGNQIRMAGDNGPKSGPLNETPAAQAARKSLAEQMGIDVEQVVIQDVASVQWPDSCLGVQNPAESCLAVITPGYRVMLEVDGQLYQVNTNADGSAWRVLEQPAQGQTGEPADPDSAVQAAKTLLAQQLGITESEITLASLEAVDWPNSCLGIDVPGRMCAQVITPGFRVVLEAEGKQYAFHTDAAGGAVMSAFTPLPEDAEGVVVWTETEDDTCQQVEIGAQEVKFGACGESMQSAALSEERLAELAHMYGDFAAFEADTPAGSVTFAGVGQREATDAEKRSLAEWAKLAAADVHHVQSSDDDGLVLFWHREGGFAGFCSDASIYRSGWVVTSSCKTGQEAGYKPYRLNSAELERLYAWMDSLEDFEVEQKDAATADSMTIRVIFSGDGEAEATPSQQEEISLFADSIYTSVMR